jgi:hypothetical protein
VSGSNGDVNDVGGFVGSVATVIVARELVLVLLLEKVVVAGAVDADVTSALDVGLAPPDPSPHEQASTAANASTQPRLERCRIGAPDLPARNVRTF